MKLKDLLEVIKVINIFCDNECDCMPMTIHIKGDYR